MEGGKKQVLDSKKGFIQHLSPRKTSRSGNPYYTLQVQSGKATSEKAVCFSPEKTQCLKKYAESRAPVSISKFMLDASGDILINDRTVISTVTPSVVPFKYHSMEPLLPKVKRELVSRETDVVSLREEPIGQENVFTLRGYVSFDNKLMKCVSTKFGDKRVKEDITFCDSTGYVTLHAWDDKFKRFESGKAYVVTNVALKAFKEERYVATTYGTEVEEITLDYPLPELQGQEVEVVTVSGFSSVASVSIQWHCRNCDTPLDMSLEVDGKVKCTNAKENCRRKYRTDMLNRSIDTRVCYEEDYGEVVVKVSPKALGKFLSFLHLDVKTVTEVQIEDAFLDFQQTIRLHVSGGFLVDVDVEVDQETCADGTDRSSEDESTYE